MALVLNTETKEFYLSLTEETRREIDRQMRSISTQVSNAIDNLVNDIENYAESRSALGKTQIISQLETLQKDNTSIFDTVGKALKSGFIDKTVSISEDIFTSGLKTEADFIATQDTLMWQAVLVNTCPDCLPLHGRIRTRAYWLRTGVPNTRNTKCVESPFSSCKCQLVPADVMPSTEEMRKPINMQAERIRRAEKKRGKKYASSTKIGFLGQINNPESTITDLRKVKKVKTT